MARASKYDGVRDELLGALAQAQESHGKSPAVRDLAERFNVGVATMHSYLCRLAEEGMVEWRPGRHRSLKLKPEAFRELS